MSVRTSRGQGHGARRISHERWLLSYADFITLLFAFFAVMYGISTVDAGKLAPAAASMQQAFSLPAPAGAPGNGVHEGVRRPAVPLTELSQAVPGSPLQEVRRVLTNDLSGAIDAGRLEIAEDARGLVLSLPVEATFAVGSAEVRPDARRLILQIASTIGPLGNALMIEGHTDDVPIRTPRFGSNWELSTARASAVVVFLIDAAGVEPVRLSAAGYGEYHPRVPNDSAANRARNRRVDIVVLHPEGPRAQPDREETP